MDIKSPLNFRGLYDYTDVNFPDETMLQNRTTDTS